jgi:hypothetical protein
VKERGCRMLLNLSMSESSRDLAVKLGIFRGCLDGLKIHQDFKAVGTLAVYSNSGTACYTTGTLLPSF